jgi:hypothetical protein
MHVLVAYYDTRHYRLSKYPLLRTCQVPLCGILLTGIWCLDLKPVLRSSSAGGNSNGVVLSVWGFYLALYWPSPSRADFAKTPVL